MEICTIGRLLPPLRGLLIVTLLASVVAAQDDSTSAEVTTLRKPGLSASPAERVISHHVAELLAVSMPKYKPIPETPEPATPANQEGEEPSNEIVRLPRYIVSGPKLPASMEILTKKELERYAMDHTIGSEDGLDRGFLNLFTIGGMWKKIPVLGSFPFVTSETNRDRGMRLYETAEWKRKMDDLTGLMNLAKEEGKVPVAKK